MKEDFAAAMRRAADFTRASDVVNATRVIQDALKMRAGSENTDSAPTHATSHHRPMLRLVKPDTPVAGASLEDLSSTGQQSASAEPLPGRGGFQPSSHRLRRPLADTLRLLREGRLRAGTIGPLPGMAAAGPMRKSRPPALPNGAQFLTRSFSCASGTRGYKLYVPASAPGHPRGLVVMLHGCKQDPDDFASGTNMNAIAEAHGMMVAYPAQTGAANASACWNWFNPADQMRGSGEPAIIAGITRQVMSEFRLGRHQVFVAGLSAGAAMAAVMRETYPDLYAAVGIHSGLPYKSANDVVSAFAAMRGDGGHTRPPNKPSRDELQPRMIVFQGKSDQTVHAANADRIVAAARSPGGVQTRQGSAGGRAYTLKVFADADGGTVLEFWLIDGAGHAWSGGSPSGSYADPQGPDASAEMMRFFLAQRGGSER